MSVVPNGNWSGRFTSTGQDYFINLPSGVDWMIVNNETVSYAAGAGTGAKFEWFRGDATGRGTVYTKTAVTNALAVAQIAAGAGFYVMDTSAPALGALNNGSTAISGVSTATPPRVTCGSTSGMATGNIVRLYNISGAEQLNGYDFTITLVSGTTFDLAYMATLGGAGTTGSFRVVNNLTYFYPPQRDITKILKTGGSVGGGGTLGANLTRITMSVTHSYTIGQKVTIKVPDSVWGMTELNNVTATIVNINQNDANSVTNTIDIDVDSSSFTTFTFPVTGGPQFTPAQVIPVGENTAQALTSGTNILGDATVNQAQYGMLLKAGTSSPAGANGDVITWIAGQSFNSTV